MNLLLTSSFYLYAHHPTPLCCSWVIKFTHSSHLINKLLLILEHFCLCSLQTWQNTDLYWKVNHVYFTLSQFIKHCYLVVSFLVYIFANNSVLRLFSKLCWTQQCTWANLCLLLSNRISHRSLAFSGAEFGKKYPSMIVCLCSPKRIYLHPSYILILRAPVSVHDAHGNVSSVYFLTC